MLNLNSKFESYSKNDAATLTVLQDADRMIDWAERVNQQWQSQDAIASRTNRWMQQVQQCDPQRLHQGIHRAFRFMMEAGRGAELKKPFYRGLLTQATEAEVKEFELQLP